MADTYTSSETEMQALLEPGKTFHTAIAAISPPDLRLDSTIEVRLNGDFRNRGRRSLLIAGLDPPGPAPNPLLRRLDLPLRDLEPLVTGLRGSITAVQLEERTAALSLQVKTEDMDEHDQLITLRCSDSKLVGDAYTNSDGVLNDDRYEYEEPSGSSRGVSPGKPGLFTVMCPSGNARKPFFTVMSSAENAQRGLFTVVCPSGNAQRALFTVVCATGYGR